MIIFQLQNQTIAKNYKISTQIWLNLANFNSIIYISNHILVLINLKHNKSAKNNKISRQLLKTQILDYKKHNKFQFQ